MAQLEVARFDAVTFFDVDGTLVSHDMMDEAEGDAFRPISQEEFDAFKPTPAVYDAFRRMTERGHASFICTGRPFFMIQPSLRALNPTGFVAEAGAYVRIGDTVVRDLHIPFDLVMEAARIFFEAGIDVDMESNEIDVGIYHDDALCPFPGCPTVRSVEEFEPYARKYRFAKFCTHFVPAETIERIRPLLEDNFSICDMQFNTYEFSPLGVDKGAGIREALAHLGHGPARTFGFGDSENDLAMVDAVETFVAMGNALPRVKKAAAYVTDDVRDDGVVTALSHFGLV